MVQAKFRPASEAQRRGEGVRYLQTGPDTLSILLAMRMLVVLEGGHLVQGLSGQFDRPAANSWSISTGGRTRAAGCRGFLQNYLGNWTDLFQTLNNRAWAASASGAHLTFNLGMVRTNGI